MRLLLAAGLIAAATPAWAMEAAALDAARTSSAAQAAQPVPAQLDATQREAYRAVFAALRDGKWAEVQTGLEAMPSGPLHNVARAELYTAKGSPQVALEPLATLLAAAPELPHASQLAALAARRGAADLPELPEARRMIPVRGQPKRTAAKAASDAVAAALGKAVQPLIRDDRPLDGEATLASVQDQLSPEALTEWRQRIAWSYYLTGDDVNARRLADQAREGAGDWTAQADWVAGLASWRQKDYPGAAQAFASAASRAGDDELRAAGLFWAARADMARGAPQQVQARLRSAARIPETFYGLIAARSLGIDPSAVRQSASLAGAGLPVGANVRAALALAEIGEDGLADKLIRHQARIGPVTDHPSLIRLASRLDLPTTQIWLAHNTPDGKRPDMAARYPAPNWTPQGGWRVDRALVMAHTLQESVFRKDAISHAGAYGLMQVLPTTAQLVDKKRGSRLPAADALRQPAVNMDYGQGELERLRDMAGITEGLLPKVIAAYNAGPGAVKKWNSSSRDGGDPLLYIESIPYWETRAYVSIVLRNYWVYQQQAGDKALSLKAIAEGKWPRFPGLDGQPGVRVAKAIPPYQPPMRTAVAVPVFRPAPQPARVELAAAKPAEAAPVAVASAKPKSQPAKAEQKSASRLDKVLGPVLDALIPSAHAAEVKPTRKPAAKSAPKPATAKPAAKD